MTTIKDWEESLARARRSGDQTYEATCLSALGNEYAWAGDISKGIECCLQAIEIRERLGDWKKVALTCKNLAAIYDVGLGNLRNAIMWLERAVAHDPGNEEYARLLAGARERLKKGGK